jgi:hypothetical protein
MNFRRDATPGARLCSCHFRDGKKENGPELFAHNIEQAFEPHHPTAEKKQRRTSSTCSTEQALVVADI